MRHIAIRSRLGTLLLLTGSAILVWCLVVWSGSSLFEHWEAHRWAARQKQSAPAAGAAIPAPQPHQVIAWLEIPRLGIHTAVLEGDDDVSLTYGAGHIPGTPLPWAEQGNVGIAAHRDRFFRALRNVKPNDRIHLQTLRGDHDYVVESTRIVKPSNVSVLDASAQPELTLVTCYPFYYVGSAPLRFIVRSREVD